MMRITDIIRNIMDRILGIVCASLFGVMTIVGTYQIVVRYFFNKPSTVSEELLTYSFAWMALFAASYVFGKRGHMKMTFLVDKFPDKLRRIWEIILELLILIFSAVVLVYGGINIMRLTMSQVTASLGIPMGMVYSVLPVSGILTIIYCVLNIISLSEKKEV